MQDGSADAPTQPVADPVYLIIPLRTPHLPFKPRLRDSKRVVVPRESVALLHLSREGLRLAALVHPPAQQSLAILRPPHLTAQLVSSFSTWFWLTTRPANHAWVPNDSIAARCGLPARSSAEQRFAKLPKNWVQLYL